MKYKILITGGAGFIGSFLVDKLVEEGHDVTILDNLEPQVHQGNVPAYLNKSAKFVQGSVLDYDLFKDTVTDVDVVFHEAAMVGVGQSMYQVRRYIGANVMGTAYLLDILANEKHNVKKVVVAASMSSYGEGAYKCESDGIVSPPLRTEEQLKTRKWELVCTCGKPLTPVLTSEEKPLQSNSIYGITKTNQEQATITLCQAYGIPAVSLRYFNVYGPRQSLSNPYTGVAAIFMSRIKNGHAPFIFEDGLQSRDFVSVHDIVQANLLAMKSNAADYEMLNVASGTQTTIKNVADVLIKLYGKDIKAEITNKYRKGDVRHCFADISKIKRILEYAPKVSFEQGMKELIEWSEAQRSVDKVDEATQELRDKGLME